MVKWQCGCLALPSTRGWLGVAGAALDLHHVSCEISAPTIPNFNLSPASQDDDPNDKLWPRSLSFETMPRRKALLIGINYYRTNHELKGRATITSALCA